MKLSDYSMKELKALLKDEKDASQMWDSLGIHSFAMDESKHARRVQLEIYKRKKDGY
jgi:hypothetical protein